MEPSGCNRISISQNAAINMFQSGEALATAQSTRQVSYSYWLYLANSGSRLLSRTDGNRSVACQEAGNSRLFLHQDPGLQETFQTHSPLPSYSVDVWTGTADVKRLIEISARHEGGGKLAGSLSFPGAVYFPSRTSTLQLPYKLPHIPTNRDNKALTRCALGSLGKLTS